MWKPFSSTEGAVRANIPNGRTLFPVVLMWHTKRLQPFAGDSWLSFWPSLRFDCFDPTHFYVGFREINKLCWHCVIFSAREQAETGFLCVFGIHLELLILRSQSPAWQAYTTTPSLGSVCLVASCILSHRHDEMINVWELMVPESVARLPIWLIALSSCRLDLCFLYLAQEKDMRWVPTPGLCCVLWGVSSREQKKRTDSIT